MRGPGASRSSYSILQTGRCEVRVGAAINGAGASGSSHRCRSQPALVRWRRPQGREWTRGPYRPFRQHFRVGDMALAQAVPCVLGIRRRLQLHHGCRRPPHMVNSRRNEVAANLTLRCKGCIRYRTRGDG